MCRRFIPSMVENLMKRHQDDEDKWTQKRVSRLGSCIDDSDDSLDIDEMQQKK